RRTRAKGASRTKSKKSSKKEKSPTESSLQALPEVEAPVMMQLEIGGQAVGCVSVMPAKKLGQGEGSGIAWQPMVPTVQPIEPESLTAPQSPDSPVPAPPPKRANGLNTSAKPFQPQGIAQRESAIAWDNVDGWKKPSEGPSNFKSLFQSLENESVGVSDKADDDSALKRRPSSTASDASTPTITADVLKQLNAQGSEAVLNAQGSEAVREWKFQLEDDAKDFMMGFNNQSEFSPMGYRGASEPLPGEQGSAKGEETSAQADKLLSVKEEPRSARGHDLDEVDSYTTDDPPRPPQAPDGDDEDTEDDVFAVLRRMLDTTYEETPTATVSTAKTLEAECSQDNRAAESAHRHEALLQMQKQKPSQPLVPPLPPPPQDVQDVHEEELEAPSLPLEKEEKKKQKKDKSEKLTPEEKKARKAEKKAKKQQQQQEQLLLAYGMLPPQVLQGMPMPMNLESMANMVQMIPMPFGVPIGGMQGVSNFGGVQGFCMPGLPSFPQQSFQASSPSQAQGLSQNLGQGGLASFGNPVPVVVPFSTTSFPGAKGFQSQQSTSKVTEVDSEPSTPPDNEEKEKNVLDFFKASEASRAVEPQKPSVATPPSPPPEDSDSGPTNVLDLFKRASQEPRDETGADDADTSILKEFAAQNSIGLKKHKKKKKGKLA
ncbi:hypothetical protein DIPPA_32517, partial [Diplonema papillatum]